MPSAPPWRSGRSEGLPQNPVGLAGVGGPFQVHRQAAARQALRSSRGSARRGGVAERRRRRRSTKQELLEDDRLRLVFTCCHPALAPDAQVALTLREVCGLTTEEIAAAFLTPAPTLAQRIVRAKAKIRDANIPYEVPAREQLADRLDSVLRVVYLVFNEGYSASSGESATRADLSGEAIRLGRLILQLLPESEVRGLLALMLLHESRRETRATADGELVLLDEQDRSLWNRALIAEGVALVRAAFSGQEIGAYCRAGGHCRRARRSAQRRRHRLERDRRALRPAAADHALAHHRTEPQRGRGHA